MPETPHRKIPTNKINKHKRRTRRSCFGHHVSYPITSVSTNVGGVCVCVQLPLQGSQRRPQGPLNMNHYANKKSAAESMLDVALLMANASQLKAVMEQGPDSTFYVPLITLISISLILQIVVGVLLIFIGESGASSANPGLHK